MNVRISPEVFPRSNVSDAKETFGNEAYQNANNDTENALVQEVLTGPEQIPTSTNSQSQETQVQVSRKNQDDIRMKEALARFKEEQAKIEEANRPEKKAQMSQDWSEFEQGNKIRLEKKAERAEKRSLPSSTSNLATGARMSAGGLSGEAQKQKQQEVEKAWQQKEAHPLLEQQLFRTQEALQQAHAERDEELIAILEEQERNLLNAVNKYRETGSSPSVLSQQTELAKRNIEIQTRDAENRKFNIPDSLITDVDFVEIPDELTPRTLNPGAERVEHDFGPDDRTNEKLHQLGISYEDLVGAVPDFASMTEGQRAYILYKAEQQSIEHIQEKADADFKQKMSEGGNKVSRFFRSIFKGGSIRRESNRDAANAHVGLDAFRDDIGNMTRHVKDGGWNISIEEQGDYRIEYAVAPEGIADEDRAFFDSYNRAATALSDIPYEWCLPTASKQEQKAFKRAHEQFEQYEESLMGALDQGEETHPEILSDINKLRAEIELNQYFSGNKNVAEKLYDMKNASYTDNLVKKIFHPSGVGLAIGGGGAGARYLGKAIFGLGGATGASAIIGGIMAYRRKNNEFKGDAKAARRGEKTKDTTNSTTLSTRTTEKINSLVSKLQDMSPNDQKYAETQALLMTRLQFTDKQMKEGRVNFGKAKDQLKNKQDLINALAFASTLNFENSEEYEKLQERLETFVEFGNESKKIARQKERTKAVLLGATIGAATAATAWMITDYFRSEDLSQTVKDAIDTNPDVNPPVVADPGVEGPNPYNPTDFEVSVDASSRGAIATFEDLQEQLEKKYPDMTKAPAHIQEFMSKTPTELAIEENMYRPSDASGNESAKIYKGGKLGFNKAGELVYTDTRNGVDILSGDGKFDGQHFDYKTYSGNVPPAQEFSDQTTAGTNGAGTSSNKLHPGTPWETDKPWLQGVDKNGVRGWTEPMYPGESTNDNIFAGTGGGVTEVGSSEVVENMNTGAQEGLERIKLSEKLSVDFEIIEDAKGRPQTKFHNVNLNNFNAYHKAYLQQDLSAYARGIATNSDFLEQNPGMTAEKVDGDLRKLTNQMIMRDQVLQEGGLDPKSDEYKILRKERDAIQKVIRNNFEWYSEDSLLSRNVFDGNKYPDPNYVFENPVEAPGVQRPSAGVETTGTSPEISKTPGAGTVEINTNNTEAAKDIKFSVTRNEAGDITELKAIAGTLDPSKVSLQEFGYDPKWLDKPEFPQTFKDTPTGKKLISDLDMVKGYVALRETLPQGSDEYNYLNETIKNRIERIESKYPSVFN